MSDIAMPTTTRHLPIDVETMLRGEDFRCAAWPVATRELGRIQFQWRRNYLDAIKSVEDAESSDTLLLGYYQLSKQTLPMVQTATVLAAAAREGMDMVGGVAEVDYLRSGNAADAPPPSSMQDLRQIPVARRPYARTLVSTVQYNRWHDIPAALGSGQRVIVAHNPLVSELMQSQPRARRFVDSGTLFHRALRQAGIDIDTRANASHLTAHLLKFMFVGMELPEPFQSRLHQLVAAKTDSILSRLLAQTRAMATVALPDELYGSSAGQHATRVLGIQVRRRGGSVFLAAHAGTTSAIDMNTSFAQLELAVASTFVMPTPAIARQPEVVAANNSLAPLKQATIVGGNGLPFLRELTEIKRVRAQRPKVVYVSTESFGFEITGLNPIPDPIYLDWQLRLAGWLEGLPIDLLCKPHPGGILKGRAHPLEGVAATSYAMFETLLPEADVVVFDNPTTTTFWKTLGTNRPIVYFDMQHFQFTQLAGTAIRERCHFVEVRFDENNRPQFETEAAEAALFDASPADPTPILDLFVG